MATLVESWGVGAGWPWNSYGMDTFHLNICLCLCKNVNHLSVLFIQKLLKLKPSKYLRREVVLRILVLVNVAVLIVQSHSCVWLYNLMNYSTPGSFVLHYLPKFSQIIESEMLSSHLTFYHPHLLLPSIFLSIWKWKWKLLSRVQTLCSPMDCPWISSGWNTGVGSLSLLQGIFPTQGWNPGLLHCRWILNQLSHKGSPRIFGWVAYPVSSRSSWPRNQTRVSCIAGRVFTNWAIKEALISIEYALCIKWPKYWSFSFSISLFNEYSGLIPLKLTGLISLLSKGLSRLFSSTTVRKHQLFHTQSSLLSRSRIHIRTWLVKKP